VLRKNYDDVCEVLEIAFKEPRFRHLFITGGTILTTYQGKTGEEWYSGFLEAIGKKLIQWPFTCLQIAALDDEGWRRIYDTGCPMVQANIEVWDRRLFEIVCPGKNEVVGYDEWLRRLISAVKIFGPGKCHLQLRRRCGNGSSLWIHRCGSGGGVHSPGARVPDAERHTHQVGYMVH